MAPALALAVACVHAQQVGGEQPGFRAAGTGANLDDRVALIQRVFRDEQKSQALVDLFELLRELLCFGGGHLAQLRIFVRTERFGLLEIRRHALAFAVGLDDLLELCALAHQRSVAFAVGRNPGVDQVSIDLPKARFDLLELLEHVVRLAQPAHAADPGAR